MAPPAPRVAVIVPCYDDGETLGETLASLEEQEPHELVVVDDGSTDSPTLEVLSALEERGVRVIRRENGGLSDARMTGVEATMARYVFPLDADDALAPGALSVLANALDADPGAALAWGDIEIWGEVEASISVARSLDPWLLTYLNDVPVASLVRRSALIDAGGWSMGSGYEDWDLWLALAERAHRGIHVAVPTLRYRRRAGRMLEVAAQRHSQLYARLRERHAPLFANRRRNRGLSSAPLRNKLIFPLLELLPLDAFTRHRIYLLVNRPQQIARLRRLRRKSRARLAVERSR